eukprot:6175534-Pleurochrysis_carterae.AAC.1
MSGLMGVFESALTVRGTTLASKSRMKKAAPPTAGRSTRSAASRCAEAQLRACTHEMEDGTIAET